MNQGTKQSKDNVTQTDPQVFVTVRIPHDVDVALEQYLVGSSLTKREVVADALRQYLEMEQ